jgi:hypothetical protein
MLNPAKNHKPETYEDLKLDGSSLILSSLEMHLPRHLLRAPRDQKFTYMRDILHDYVPPALRYRVCFNFNLDYNFQYFSLKKFT